MSEPTHVKAYRYVRRDCTGVREILRERAPEIFERATKSAAARASAVGASLHAEVAGLDIGVDVRVSIHGMLEEEGVAGLSPVTRIAFGWEARRATALFPVMRAELSMWPLTATETQIELTGSYRPPLGPVGTAVDALVGHRLAEAVVHRFLDDIAEQIEREIPGTP